MIPPNLPAYLAEAHRRDLVREAQQAALSAEARPATESVWSRALSRAFVAAVHRLVAAHHRLRVRLVRRSARSLAAAITRDAPQRAPSRQTPECAAATFHAHHRSHHVLYDAASCGVCTCVVSI
jgi:hypothetical protein